MDQEQYINQRLEDQICWYEKKGNYNKTCANNLKTIEIICAAIIPFVAGFGNVVPFGSIITGILGVIIGISAGIAALNKYHDNWMAYRTTSEMLKHEKYLFLTHTIPYDTSDAFTLLVQSVEGLISKENTQWSSVNRSTEKEKTNDHELELS
ncbi:MAG: DUF4231 domain-containing protein [Chitinispirillaceae bacterium]|nr:DUF4231 domain-containing protein [Chitinispirillaceae bacterium]